jgi:hypothetical protein
MKGNIITIFTILILLIFNCVSRINSPINEVKKLKSPSKGVYLGAYPDFGGYEDLVTSKLASRFNSIKPSIWFIKALINSYPYFLQF